MSIYEWNNVTTGQAADAAASLMRTSQQSISGAFDRLESLGKSQEKAFEAERREGQEQNAVAAMEALLSKDLDSVDSFDIKEFGVQDADLAKQLLLAADNRKGQLQERAKNEILFNNTMMEEEDKLLYGNTIEKFGTDIEQYINQGDYKSARGLVENIDTGNGRVDLKVRDTITRRIQAHEDRQAANEKALRDKETAEITLRGLRNKEANESYANDLIKGAFGVSEALRASHQAEQAAILEIQNRYEYLTEDGSVNPNMSPEALAAMQEEIAAIPKTDFASDYTELTRMALLITDPKKRENVLNDLNDMFNAENKLDPNTQREINDWYSTQQAALEEYSTEIEEQHTKAVKENILYASMMDTRSVTERVTEITGLLANKDVEIGNWDSKVLAEIATDGLNITVNGLNMPVKVTPELLKLFAERRGFEGNETFNHRFNDRREAERTLTEFVREQVSNGTLREAERIRGEVEIGRERVKETTEQIQQELNTRTRQASGNPIVSGRLQLEQQVAAQVRNAQVREANADLTQALNGAQPERLTDARSLAQQRVSAAHAGAIEGLYRAGQQHEQTLERTERTLNIAREKAQNSVTIAELEQNLAQTVQEMGRWSPEAIEVRGLLSEARTERVNNHNRWRVVDASEESLDRLENQRRLAEESLQDVLRRLNNLGVKGN